MDNPVITGMRRVGKTTALKYLLEKVGTENKIYFDLERVEHRYLFRLDNYKEIERSLQTEGIDLKKKPLR
jgi:predicted AAA+ superfamily ATPase